MAIMTALAMPASVGLALAGLAGMRLAWGKSGRGIALIWGAWAALAAGVILAAMAGGAWGVSIVTVWVTAAALLLLAYAAARAPRSIREAPRQRSAGAFPRTALCVARRLTSFLLAGPCAALAALCLSLALRSAFHRAGAGEANANVAALFAFPLLWAILTHMLLINGSRSRQLALLSGSIVLSSLFLAAG